MSWFCDAHRAEYEVCDHRDLNQPPHAYCTFDIWPPNTLDSIRTLLPLMKFSILKERQLRDTISKLIKKNLF